MPSCQDGCSQQEEDAMNMAHVHLLLTHIPILGSLFLTVLFLVALISRNVFLQKVVLWFLVGIALLTVSTFLSGDEAVDAVEHLPGVSTAMISTHELVAKFGLGLMFGTGVMALVGALVSRSRPTLPRVLVGIVLTVLVLNAALFAYIGFLGGQIHHQEIRSSATFSRSTQEPGVAVHSSGHVALDAICLLPRR